MLESSAIAKIKKTITEKDLSTAALFNVLGDKNRYCIFKLLTEQKELCVSDLAAVLSITVSAASQHLRILVLAELVAAEKKGQMVCYSPNGKNIKIKLLARLL